MADEGESELRLGPTARLRVVRSCPEELEVEATYTPGSQAPPNHLHPAQDEHFEILEGAMQVQLDGGPTRTISAGDTLDVPRGTPHVMWNSAAAPARTRWITRPAGRTEDWFRTLDSFQRRIESGESVDGEEYARALEEYADVFELVLP